MRVEKWRSKPDPHLFLYFLFLCYTQIVVDFDGKLRFSFKEKKITENDWFNITFAIHELESFENWIIRFIVIIILLVILLSSLFNLIKFFLINPLLPFWNSANDQTKATLVFGFIFSIPTVILTHMIRNVLEKPSQKDKGDLNNKK